MKCIYCDVELEDHEYKLCGKCLTAMRRKYAREYLSMSGLEFEDYLDERIRLEKKRDQIQRKRLQD